MSLSGHQRYFFFKKRVGKGKRGKKDRKGNARDLCFVCLARDNQGIKGGKKN